MAATSEDGMRQVAQASLGVPFLASGVFRTVPDVKRLAGVPGAVVIAAQWAWIKKRSRLPAYPYVVVTDHEVIVLEFLFGSTLRMRRIVGRWPKSDVRVLHASPEHRLMTLVLPLSRSPVELEGAYHSDGEREVVAQLVGLSPEP